MAHSEYIDAMLSSRRIIENGCSAAAGDLNLQGHFTIGDISLGIISDEQYGIIQRFFTLKKNWQ